MRGAGQGCATALVALAALAACSNSPASGGTATSASGGGSAGSTGSSGSGATSASGGTGSGISTGQPGSGGGTSSMGTTSGGASASGGSSGGAAIVAPNDTWTWVDFPTSVCASGTPTGLAINPHAGATQLLIYLEGGGFCDSLDSCWGPKPSANNLAGYDATTFAGAPQLAYAALGRKTAGNPFAAMNLVYVPYCTGDLHSGSKLTTFPLPDGGSVPTYFYGANDLELFLARLVPTFPAVTRVFLLGTSAGGFGTIFDFNLIAQAFGTGVDILDDSGPPLVANGKTDNAGMFAGWSSVLPDAGFTSLAQLLDYDLQLQTTFTPPGQFGFLSFESDTTIGPDFGYDAGTQYPAVMQAFSESLPPAPTAATFLVFDHFGHVVESDSALDSQTLAWMTELVTRDASWGDVVLDGG